MNCPLCNYEEKINLKFTIDILRQKNYIFMYDKNEKTIDIINPRNNKQAKFFFAFNCIKECKNCKEIIMKYNGFVKNMTMFRTTIAIYKDNNSYINIHDLEGDFYRIPGGFKKYRLSNLIINQIKTKNCFKKYCCIL